MTVPDRAGVVAPDPVRAWTVTGMLVIFIVINWADKSILGLAAEPLMAELRISPAELGFIGSSFFFLFSVTGVLVGFLADRVRAQWVLIGLAIAWSLTQLPVLLSATGTSLLISRIALGAAEGPAAAMAAASAFTWFPKEKRALPGAWITAGSSIAKIAVAPVLTFIIVGYGWRAAFVTLILLGVLWSVAWFFLGGDGPLRVEGRRKTVPFRRIGLSRTFLGCVLAAFPMYALVSMLLTWLPSYLEKALGFSRVQAGVMFGLPSISSIIVMVGISAFSDRLLSRGASSRLTRGIFSAVGLLVGGGLLTLVPLLDNRYLALTVVVLGYGIGVAVFPLTTAAVSHIAPPGQQASTVGFLVAVYSLAGLLGPWLTGVLVGAAESPVAGFSQAFQLFGGCAVLGGVAAWLLIQPDRDAAAIAR
ncbi:MULTISPECIES: MFS transporter [unclassified Crossiella]|uniref:MFS transporter n=1 Tax=unclassified Crossiella TaxID=2620835 RepID=UPI001FFEC80D|nr:MULTISPECIES: MFS transporter [unclassified Crossiella]MCK2241381.1 MFS transporter [Crossiella sp. S99.2]MCK2253475.1 MFS transporter [Crossiella sp. S99.1]